jgi:sulfur carrier protein ThiS
MKEFLMAVKLTLRDKVYEVKPNLRLEQALKLLGLHPDSYLAIRNGEMITDDEVLRDGDIIKLVSVISGG